MSDVDRPSPARVPRRPDLASCVRRVLNHGGRYNPDVLLVEWDGHQAVVKDFAPRSWWVRNTVGRFLTAWESRAWRLLDGHPAVPRFLGPVDAHAFAVEYRPGVPMTRSSSAAIPPDFPERLEEALAEMHRRGVVHLDLSHRSNVLADAGGAPVLIDFGSAVACRPGGLVARLLLPSLARIDRRALAKWRGKLARYRREASEGGGEVATASAGGVSGSGRGASRPT